MDSSTHIFYFGKSTKYFKFRISNQHGTCYLFSMLFCCCYGVKDFKSTQALTPKQKHTPAHVTTSQHFMLTLPPSVPYAFLPFSPTPTPYMLNLLHITKRSYVPRSTKYVPLHMCSFTSLLSNFMLMILNNIPRDQGDMLNMQLQHLYLQQFGTLVS